LPLLLSPLPLLSPLLLAKKSDAETSLRLLVGEDDDFGTALAFSGDFLIGEDTFLVAAAAAAGVFFLLDGGTLLLSSLGSTAAADADPAAAGAPVFFLAPAPGFLPKKLRISIMQEYPNTMLCEACLSFNIPTNLLLLAGTGIR
jgi:hypothetical protein